MLTKHSKRRERTRCEYCGELATPLYPVRETVVAPPCDGYRAEVVVVHRGCGRDWAADMVR